jgi:hypothetical protein
MIIKEKMYQNLPFKWGCGSGSGLNPDPGARKLRNFSGNFFSYYFKKKLTTEKV